MTMSGRTENEKGDITLLGNARSLNSKVAGSGEVHTTGLNIQ